MAATYLIGTWESQSVQQWNENISWNEEAQNVSTSHEPILSPISVDFCWHAYDGHSRLEWGDEGQRNRNASHAPVCHQELLRSPLAPTRQGVEHAYARRGSQQARKYHIVHSCEVLLVRRVHLEGTGRIVSPLVKQSDRRKTSLLTPLSTGSLPALCAEEIQPKINEPRSNTLCVNFAPLVLIQKYWHYQFGNCSCRRPLPSSKTTLRFTEAKADETRRRLRQYCQHIWTGSSPFL